MKTSPLLRMSFEELVQHITNQHPDMKNETIEEMAESILEEVSTAYVGG
ncbi:MAG: hypothetical protein RIQ39_985 [Actinomycetota bacterium]|jgi:hypothetical protein